MSKAMTAEQVTVAQDALKGAAEMIAAGRLTVNGVQVKAVHRGNVMSVFPPGIAEVVRRYLRGW